MYIVTLLLCVGKAVLFVCDLKISLCLTSNRCLPVPDIRRASGPASLRRRPR